MPDMKEEDISKRIIAMEIGAIEELTKGNYRGYLSIYAEDITYFAPFQSKRIDGIGKVEAFYESMEGNFHVETYEMIDPVVQISGGIAVLSYKLVSHIGGDVLREQCTEDYRQETEGQWKIMHSHWSLTQTGKSKE